MTAVRIPASAKQLAALVKEGEGPALEFKRSTGELKEGIQTLCAFLNGSGGVVLLGVPPEGTIEGQAVSDQTLRDIAQAADRFEPPAHVAIHRIKVKAGREVVAATVEGGVDMRPFTYEGHPYERVGTTTRRMPQAKYERLLVERGHAKRRWENLPAEGLALKDLDRKEILRTRELAIQQNRISPDTRRDIGAILDRLGLRVAGVLTRAAQVLYGTRFMPDYPQCLLKSYGRLPGGVTVEQLSGPHLSKPTNPLIAEAFHRTGAVEVWGRGTNRVIEMCEKHGAPPPVFEEKQGFLVVTFKAPLVAGGAAGTSRSESGDRVTAEVTAQVTAEVTAPACAEAASAGRQVAAFCREPQPAKAIMAELGLKHWKTFQTNYLAPLMAMGILERTIPDKPRSRMQRYKTTEAGPAALRQVGKGAGGPTDEGGMWYITCATLGAVIGAALVWLLVVNRTQSLLTGRIEEAERGVAEDRRDCHWL